MRACVGVCGCVGVCSFLRAKYETIADRNELKCSRGPGVELHSQLKRLLAKADPIYSTTFALSSNLLRGGLAPTRNEPKEDATPISKKQRRDHRPIQAMYARMYLREQVCR